LAIRSGTSLSSAKTSGAKDAEMKITRNFSDELFSLRRGFPYCKLPEMLISLVQAQ